MKRAVITARQGRKERIALAVRGGRKPFRGAQGPAGPKDPKDLRGSKGLLKVEAEELAAAEEESPAER
jgi:hypothetical protein